MGEWKGMRIGDVIKEVSREKRLEPSTKYRLLGVKWYGKGVFLREKKYGKEIKATKLYEVKQGDFIYNRLFAWKSSFAIVPGEFDGCLVSNEFPLFTCCEGKLLPEFLLSYMLLPENIASVNNLSGGMSSVSRKRFKEKDFLNFEVPQYDIEIQSRICQRLKKMSEFSINQDLESAHQLSLIKQLRQRILQDAIEGKLTAKWRVQHPDLISGNNHASKLLEKIKAEKERLIKEGNTSTKLSARIKKDLSRSQSRGKPLAPITDAEKPFDVPEGWAWCRYGEVINLISGQHIDVGDCNSRGEGFPYITGPADFGSINPTVSRWTTKPKVFSDKNQILITVKGSGVGKLNINDNDGLVISRQLMAIQNLLNNNDYCFCWLRTLFASLQDLKDGLIPGIGRDDILLKKFPIPPVTEQQAIVDRVDKLMAMIDELEKQVSERKKQSEMLMQSVLREAFAGNK